MKLRWVEFALQTLILFLVVTIGYFFIFQYPALATNKTLSGTARAVGNERAKIVQPYLLLQQLQGLKSGSADLQGSHDRIVGKLKGSAKSFPEEIKIGWIFAVTPEAQRINRQLRPTIKPLGKVQKKVFTSQQDQIKQVLAFDSVITQLYAYRPQSDLIRADKSNKLEILSARSKAAFEGLETIKTRSGDQELQVRIQITQATLVELITAISGGDLTATEVSRQKAIAEFSQLQIFALEMQANRIRQALIVLEPNYKKTVLQFDAVLAEIRKLQKNS